jgi:hypothetical protein
VAGAVIAAPHVVHAAESATPRSESSAHQVPMHGNAHDWMGGSVSNNAAGDSTVQPNAHNFVAQPTEHSGSHSGSHGAFDLANLRGDDASASQHSSVTDTDRGWKGAAPHHAESAVSNGANKRPSAEHETRAGADSQAHADGQPHDSNGWHGADVALPSEDWSHSLLDAGPYLDLSALSVDGANGHAQPNGLSQHGTINLPTLDSVIDLRHDFFADAPLPQARGQDFAHDGRFGGGEQAFAGPGTVEFMHNLANDLEAAVQNHDAR